MEKPWPTPRPTATILIVRENAEASHGRLIGLPGACFEPIRTPRSPLVSAYVCLSGRARRARHLCRAVVRRRLALTADRDLFGVG